MNQAKVHARFVMLGSIFLMPAVLWTNTTTKMIVYHVPPDGTRMVLLLQMCVKNAESENIPFLKHKAVKHVEMDSIQIKIQTMHIVAHHAFLVNMDRQEHHYLTMMDQKIATDVIQENIA